MRSLFNFCLNSEGDGNRPIHANVLPVIINERHIDSRQINSNDTPGRRQQVTLFGLICLLVLSLVCIDTAQAASPHSNKKGLELARLVYDRPDGNDSAARVTMTLGEKGKNQRERLLYSYAKEKGAGERWTLMRFITPADIRGTGLLTKDHPGDESDQWLYLPALDRVRRIASSRKGGRFVGSDFFYGDLRDREVDMDHHRFIGEGKVGKIACDVVVSTPVDRSNSAYSKRARWIHRKTLIPLRVDFYEKGRKKPSKRLRARKIKKIQGYWTVLESTMYDLKSGHRTSLRTKKIKYDQGLPDKLFSQRALSDDSMEKAFRP